MHHISSLLSNSLHYSQVQPRLMKLPIRLSRVSVFKTRKSIWFLSYWTISKELVPLNFTAMMGEHLFLKPWALLCCCNSSGKALHHIFGAWLQGFTPLSATRALVSLWTDVFFLCDKVWQSACVSILHQGVRLGWSQGAVQASQVWALIQSATKGSENVASTPFKARQQKQIEPWPTTVCPLILTS